MEPAPAPDPGPRPRSPRTASTSEPAPATQPDPAPAVEPDPAPPAEPEPEPEPRPEPAPTVAEVRSDAPRAVQATAAQQCIKAQPPAGFTVGQSVPFVAERCVDDGQAVTLWFRPAGSDSWQSVAMPFRLGAHRAVVRADDRFSGGLDFFIETPGAAFGSRSEPKRVGVR